MGSGKNRSSASQHHSSRRRRHRRNSQRTNRQSRNRGNVAILSCGLVFSLLLVIALFFTVPRMVMTPEETVVSFTEEFNDGEYDRMLSYVEPSEAKSIRKMIGNLPDSVVGTALKTIMPFLVDITNTRLYPEFVTTTIEGKRAVVTVMFPTIDEKNCYDVYLTKKHGIWYIKYIWISSQK